MDNLVSLIPGFYADPGGRLYLAMAEFLLAHGMPDSPEVRTVVWEEIRDVFGDIAVSELSD
ncbi:MAG TPA: hypothetical protein VGJ51_13305 [Candidatus Angelobacter sp.]|jgi:hypothetical protein